MCEPEVLVIISIAEAFVVVAEEGSTNAGHDPSFAERGRTITNSRTEHAEAKKFGRCLFIEPPPGFATT